MTAIYYVLVASIYSTYGAGIIKPEPQEFYSYGECVHAAKVFFWERIDNYPLPGEGRRTEFPGGVVFEWHCEGFVRSAK